MSIEMKLWARKSLPAGTAFISGKTKTFVYKLNFTSYHEVLATDFLAIKHSKILLKKYALYMKIFDLLLVLIIVHPI